MADLHNETPRPRIAECRMGIAHVQVDAPSLRTVILGLAWLCLVLELGAGAMVILHLRTEHSVETWWLVALVSSLAACGFFYARRNEPREFVFLLPYDLRTGDLSLEENVNLARALLRDDAAELNRMATLKRWTKFPTGMCCLSCGDGKHDLCTGHARDPDDSEQLAAPCPCECQVSRGRAC